MLAATTDAPGPSSSFDDSTRLLDELRQMTSQLKSQWGGDERIAATQREIDAILFAAMSRMVDAGPCAEPAAIYLSTAFALDLSGVGVLMLNVIGDIGSQRFAFASGTSQASIIDAVNSFSDSIGATAQQSIENPQRVQFRSVLVGSSSWVRVTQLNFPDYPYYLLADTPQGFVMASDLADAGFDGFPGDADCDHLINQADLTLVIDNWGTCLATSQPCVGDVDVSGTVDVDDLLLVIQNWG